MNDNDPINGVRLYRRPDGTLGVQLLMEGNVFEAEPHPQDYSKPLGLYDENMNPIGPASQVL